MKRLNRKLEKGDETDKMNRSHVKRCYITFPDRSDCDNRAIYMFIKYRGFPHRYENGVLIFDNVDSSEVFSDIIDNGLKNLKNRYKINSYIRYE